MNSCPGTGQPSSKPETPTKGLGDTAYGSHTAEPPRLQLGNDSTPLPGKVGQDSRVAAVDLSRLDATQRTWALDRLRRGDDGDKVRPGYDPQDRKAGWNQRHKTVRQSRKLNLSKHCLSYGVRQPLRHEAAPKTRMSPDCVITIQRNQ